jgi:putative Holliday junction resolvase
VVALAAELGAERILVGLPLSLGGGDSAQTAETRAWAERLRAAVDVPVELYDERFTTRLAGRAGGSGSLDSRAAAVLLDEWLTVSGHLPIEGGTD